MTLTMLILLLLQLPVMLALFVFSCEIVAGVVGWRIARVANCAPRSVVLMPAHNEAKVISASVASALAALGPADRLLVIADNCTDDTAVLARAGGAEVVVRDDPDRRGKGYALAHGMLSLDSDPPDCVIVLDADCRVDPDCLKRLAALAFAEQRPVQGCYLFEPDPANGPLTRISGFAFLLKNRVRQAGVSAFGDTCLLTGSGMAFPFGLLAGADLANGEIVEDLVLGIRLSLQGHSPLFDGGANIVSSAAPTDRQTQGQRKRWEHGFIVAAARFVPILLFSAIRRFRRDLLWTAFHLLVPPFMLLICLAIITCLVTALAAVLELVPPMMMVLPISLTVLSAASVFLAWSAVGRRYLTVRDALALPGYLWAKISIWTTLISARQSTWNRTER